MKKIKNVSLIGLGAIGSAYGSKLHDTLQDSFRVVVDQTRLDTYKKHGVRVNDQAYPFHYITPETNTSPADLVLFAVKNAELPQAIEAMRQHIGEDTIILSLLNGISSEEIIYAATKNEHILPSMAVEIDAVRAQHNTQLSTYGRIEYGDPDYPLSEDVLSVKALFETAGIAYKISENITKTMWWKFMINVGINQTSAVLKAPYGVFQRLPHAYEWVEAAMREVVVLSQHAGIHLTEADIKAFRPVIDNLSPQGKTSMLQDVEAGRKTEVAYFAGKVCELGEKYQVSTPINEQLYQLITIMEDMATLK